MPYYPELIGIFGSYARDENTKKSDIDIFAFLLFRCRIKQKRCLNKTFCLLKVLEIIY